MNEQNAVSFSNFKVTEHYDKEAILTIKNTIAKGATDNELFQFLYLAKSYNLDPFKREIWFIKDKSGIVTIMTSRDGYLKHALEDEGYESMNSFPVYEGDEFSIDASDDPPTITHKMLFKSNKIRGAWAKVCHKNRKPIIVWCPFDEYNKKGYKSWDNNPSAMIQKCAEAMALKRQFSITGLVTSEEIEHQGFEQAKPVQAEVVNEPEEAKEPTPKEEFTHWLMNEDIDGIGCYQWFSGKMKENNLPEYKHEKHFQNSVCLFIDNTSSPEILQDEAYSDALEFLKNDAGTFFQIYSQFVTKKIKAKQEAESEAV